MHAPWTRDVSLVVSGFFVASLGLQINRMCLSTFREENDIGTFSSYFASLCVNIIATCSHTSTLFFDWGGTCEDAFGVQTSAGHWAEWMIGVPLLIFIVLSSTKNIYLSYFYFACASGFCSPCLYMVYTTQQELHLLIQRATNQTKKGAYQRKILLASRKATLGFGLGVLLPIFGVIYFCAIKKIFSPDLTYVAFNTFSAFTKVFFSSLCMDAHLEISHPAIGLIDKENFSSASRRAFLRYVFHEIRVPLNSITLGLQVLSDGVTYNHSLEQEKETVMLMKEASQFMGEVLNDVMALQRIEEGSLELINNPFSLTELLNTLEDSFAEVSKDLDVHLYTKVEPGLPEKYVGDKFRIGHVLANLTSNALKFSSAKGEVRIYVEQAWEERDFLSADEYDPKSADRDERDKRLLVNSNRDKRANNVGSRISLKFSISDDGRGISEEDQADDIFSPFRHLKSGNLESNRGSGLGLAICRELVRMHGGKIYYTSAVGKGTTFNVILPLHIYTGNDNLSSPNKLFKKRMYSFRSHSHMVDSPNTSPLVSSRPESGGSSHSLGVLSPDEDGDVARSWSRSPSISRTEDSTSPKPTRAVSLSQLDSAHNLGIAFFSHESTRSPGNRSPSTSSPFQEMLANKRDGEGPKPERSAAISFMKAYYDSQVASQTGEATKPVPQSAVDSPLILSRVPSLEISSRENRNLQALVVDDVLSNRKLLAMLLVKKGIDVHFAESGKHCVDTVESLGLDFFDIIFMDNTMPIMTGIEATRELRRKGFRHLILGVTGNSMIDELNDFLNAGTDIVITKPMRLQLIDQVLLLIKERGCVSIPDSRIMSKDDTMKWVPRKAGSPN
eukprot:gene26290-31757_t